MSGDWDEPIVAFLENKLIHEQVTLGALEGLIFVIPLKRGCMPDDSLFLLRAFSYTFPIILFTHLVWLPFVKDVGFLALKLSNGAPFYFLIADIIWGAVAYGWYSISLAEELAIFSPYVPEVWRDRLSRSSANLRERLVLRPSEFAQGGLAAYDDSYLVVALERRMVIKYN